MSTARSRRTSCARSCTRLAAASHRSPGRDRAREAAVTAAEPDIVPGLLDEAHRFAQRANAEEAITRMQRSLELGGQTRVFELDAYDPDQHGER